MESLTFEQDMKVAWWYLFEPKKHKEYVTWVGRDMSEGTAFDKANKFKNNNDEKNKIK